MKKQKHVLYVNDISGMGRCALTINLPILSAMGMQTSILPTTLLSTPLDYNGATFYPLTEQMKDILQHWQTLSLSFDALSSGFMGSREQMELMYDYFLKHKKTGSLIFVDPIMADDGRLYDPVRMDKEYILGLKKLCTIADIIVPNITEAVFLLQETYQDGPYDKEYIEDIVLKLHALGAKNIVLTGVSLDETALGAAVYNAEERKISYVMAKKIGHRFTGTGDIFSSVLLGCYLDGQSLQDSCKKAVQFTCQCIEKTASSDKSGRMGIQFETELYTLMEKQIC